MLSANKRDKIFENCGHIGTGNASQQVDNIVAEVFEETEGQQSWNYTNSAFIQNGRRHTFGFPEHKMQFENQPLPFMKYDATSATHNMSRIPFPISQVTPLSPEIAIPSDFEVGRRASECASYSRMTDNLLGRQNQFRNAEYLAGAFHQNKSEQNSPMQMISPSLQSPRKRRTGLRTVTDNPPNIPPELKIEVENRIYNQQAISPLPPSILASSPLSPSSSSSLSPSPFSSPCKLNLRQRRSGLSVVTEGKQTCRRVSSLKEPYSLNSDRHSPIRRLSDANHPSLSDCSLSELKTLQVEYPQETLAFDFSPAKVSQHQYLQLPISPLLPDQLPYGEEPVIQLSQGPDELMAEMYEEMYPTVRREKQSRSFSVPTSPSMPLGPSRERHSLTHHLQELSLYQQKAEQSDLKELLRSKGSITQGVPSLSAVTPCETPSQTPLSTPKRQRRSSLASQSSQPPNYPYNHIQGDGCPVIRVTDDQGDRVGIEYNQVEEGGQSVNQCANKCQLNII